MATPFAEGNVADADLVADGERRHVDLEGHRDVAGHGFDGEVEDQLLEQSAVAHAGGLTDEVHGDLGADGDVAADADEVDVHQLAPRGVALDLAGEGEDVVAVDLERDQRVGTALAGEDVPEVAGGHRDHQGVGVEAVDDRRDLAGATQPTRRARALLGALLGNESDVSHDARNPSTNSED